MTLIGTELQQMCCMMGTSNCDTVTSNWLQLQTLHMHIVLQDL